MVREGRWKGGCEGVRESEMDARGARSAGARGGECMSRAEAGSEGGGAISTAGDCV